MSFRFPKSTHLCGQLRIQQVYQTGQKFTVWPLRITFVLSQDVDEAKVLVWAPKSNFKHAVDRNHLRRLMREAWRLNKQLLPSQHIQYICFNYLDKQLLPYDRIEKSMIKALNKLSQYDQSATIG